MNITFNSDTVALLIHEIDDILGNVDISAGTCDDLSNLLNALIEIPDQGSIVIVMNNDNIDDAWDDWDNEPDAPIKPPNFIPA
jgi:hypothetical protein